MTSSLPSLRTNSVTPNWAKAVTLDFGAGAGVGSATADHAVPPLAATDRVGFLPAPGEVISSGNNAFAHAGIPRVMSSCAGEDEFAARPFSLEPPWRDEKGA